MTMDLSLMTVHRTDGNHTDASALNWDNSDDQIVPHQTMGYFCNMSVYSEARFCLRHTRA